MYANSSLINSIYIPDYFMPNNVSTENGTLIYDKDFTFATGTGGLTSIITLNTVPFIDLSKYDFLRRKWYYVDEFGGLWRKYIPGEYVIEQDYIYSSKWNLDTPRYYSQEGLGTAYFNESEFSFYEYSPISLKINDIGLTDISNYTGITNVTPKINHVNPEQNKEFYYDRNSTIYTNQDLNEYDIENISLTYKTNIDRINVKFRMNTNTTSMNNYTPIVDYYIVSLTGQNL